MLLNINNFCKGYILLEITGFSTERFINLASHNNIYLWDIKKNKNGVVLKVSIKGFKLLKKYARKTGCKIKILKKSGLPFKVYKYKKRKIFAFGMILLICLLYFFSSFIWKINIYGNKKIKSNEILNFCEQKKIKVGTLKYKVNTKKLERELLEHFSNISWINIKIKGSKMIMNIKEIIPTEKIINKKEPCDIVAKKDGLILNIITSAGTPKVKINDVVKKGDILVSGEILIENNNSESNAPSLDYVHADAKVLAKTYYQINFKIPYEYTLKKYTGRTKKNYLVAINNKKINLLSRVKFKSYDKTTQQKNFGFIKLLINEYREFIPIKKIRSISDAKKFADKIINNRIIREFDFETDIFDKQINFIDRKKYLDVQSVIIAIERIDKKIELQK